MAAKQKVKMETILMKYGLLSGQHPGAQLAPEAVLGPVFFLMCCTGC